MNKPHHMKGRTNAAKPGDKKATSNIQFKLLQEQKALIVRNLERGETLSQFMLRLAMNEAKRREKDLLNGEGS